MQLTRPKRPQIHWWEAGEGPTLVLLNGWSASGLAWPRRWLESLESDYRVIRIDNRGSGFSRFAETPFTMADLADDVEAVLDATETETATVAGMSMGGMIAQEFALRHGDRLSGLVLIATRPPAPAYAVAKASSMLVDLLAPPRRGEPLEAYFTRLWTGATGAGFAGREPERIAELVRQIAERPTPKAMLLHQFRAVSGWGHAERLRRLHKPTAVVHGAEDRLIEPENGRRLAHLIPGSRLFELPGVGHLPPLEAPDDLLEVIARVNHGDRQPHTADVVPIAGQNAG
jgi:pimeloyl-ACP methyl ester carboxylesterase